jgi:hypothetical protein
MCYGPAPFDCGDKYGKAKDMHSSPSAVSPRHRRKEDLVYQVITVAAMVTMLASVWIF